MFNRLNKSVFLHTHTFISARCICRKRHFNALRLQQYVGYDLKNASLEPDFEGSSNSRPSDSSGGLLNNV